EACSSQNNDTIGASVGNDEKSKADASLEVLKNFTVAVFDSVDNPAKLTVIVPPFRLSQPLDGNSVVRVINASVNYPGYTLSLGARDYKNSPSKFISGELISPAIQYGELSKHVVISSGIVPLAVYSTEDPSRLIYNSLADFKADKSYLIFILDDPTNNGKIKISLVEENDVNKSAEFLTEGSFTQVVNLIPDVETVIVAVPPALNQAKIYFSDLLATIMNPGSGDITISGSLLNINNDITKRNLIIATGASQNKELLLFQYTPLKIESVNYKRRFINACKEFSTVNVALNVDTMLIAENISYGSASSVENVTLERTTSFLFINPVDSTVIRRIDGLNLPFGKNFTFILGGNKTSGYTIVQVQEY
ncbi:MAG: DUF4397 domain-containing protein, partial [Ignavibacteriae bacterium]|nr:DUF4397 domain-containing protein [Ignavibacteriota bacterium]